MKKKQHKLKTTPTAAETQIEPLSPSPGTPTPSSVKSPLTIISHRCKFKPIPFMFSAVFILAVIVLNFGISFDVNEKWSINSTFGDNLWLEEGENSLNQLLNEEQFESLQAFPTLKIDGTDPMDFTQWLRKRHFLSERNRELTEVMDRYPDLHMKVLFQSPEDAPKHTNVEMIFDVSLILINPRGIRLLMKNWDGPCVIIFTNSSSISPKDLMQIMDDMKNTSQKIHILGAYSENEPIDKYLDTVLQIGILAADTQFVLPVLSHDVTVTSNLLHSTIYSHLVQNVQPNLNNGFLIKVYVCSTDNCSRGESCEQKSDNGNNLLSSTKVHITKLPVHSEDILKVSSISTFVFDKTLMRTVRNDSQLTFSRIIRGEKITEIHSLIFSKITRSEKTTETYRNCDSFLLPKNITRSSFPKEILINIQKSSISDEDLLDLQWMHYKESHSHRIKDAQYCMLWCLETDEIFKEPLKAIYRDSVPPGIVHPYRIQYQKGGENATGLRCCQIATRDSLTILHDSLEEDFEDEAITMVTMGTFSRIQALRKIRQRWIGPLIFVMLTADHNDELFGVNWRDDVKKMTDIAKQENWKNILIIHYASLMEKEQQVLRKDINYETREMRNNVGKDAVGIFPDFPINALRNIAMDFVRSRYVFANDIDLLPNQGMYEFGMRHIPMMKSTDKIAISSVPFEKRACLQWSNFSFEYPKTFVELDDLLMKGAIRPSFCEPFDVKRWNRAVFHFDEQNFVSGCLLKRVNRWNMCHAARFHNYEEYFARSRVEGPEGSLILLDPQRIQSDEQILYWEPYVFQSRVTTDGPLIRYNELFVSRGFDKVSYLSALRRLGYTFYTSTQNFLFHHDHPKTVWFGEASENRLRSRIWTIMETYLKDLKEGRK